ncbi:oligosaccharide flippase family protein [Idiomarina abyssalis]|uniref:oligosaccharide flippase family protein n=1 Tax=Idiomarina abyssalis TaxID=86102 RepID=UPI002301D667|nr:oligosaccharide flippase family protein [Idiomarina abyssalis]MDA6067153.1 oligosaccharide flippase family protein [Idiomarina abyssalis]
MLKNVGILTFGTGISQGINLLGLLFLSRLYTPAEFGLYAVLLGVITIAGAASSFRYEMTILLPKSESKASIATALSIITCLISNLLFLVVLLTLYAFGVVGVWWLIIPVASIFTSFINIAAFLQNRNKQYLRIVAVQILKAITFILVAVIAGSYGATNYGLLLGLLFSVTLPAILIICFDFRIALSLAKKIEFSRLFAWGRIHRKFIYYSTPAVLANSLASQAPVFLLTFFFGASLAGYYSMVQKVMMAPVTLVSGAVNKVYMQRISTLRANRAEIFPFTFGILKKFVFPAIVIAVLMVTLFLMDSLEFIFGKKWLSIDNFALAMVPAFLFSFISKSISGFAILGRNELGLVYQVVLLISITLAIWLSYLIDLEGYEIFLMISATLLVCYVGQSSSILKISKNLDSKIKSLR